MEEIKGENYTVKYDKDTATVFCSGTLRLYGNEGYEPITKLFNQVTTAGLSTVTLDLTELQFLNSAGINTISKFVIQLRNLKNIKLVIKGTSNFPWQPRSLKNLEKLLPGLVLEIN